MKTPCLIAALVLWSCTEDVGTELSKTDATSMAADASSVAAPRGTQATSFDAGPRSPPAWRAAACAVPAGSGPLPASPAKFRVELAKTACFGTCSIYSFSVDQDGRVRFYGESYVARYGLHEKQIAPADARAIYDSLYQAGYDALNRCYVDEEDGCSLYTDAPSTLWSVVGDDTTKLVRRYHGCRHPSPELARVDEVGRTVAERAGLSAWVQRPDDRYVAVPADLKVAGSYRVSHVGQSIGMLTIQGGSDPMKRPEAGISLGPYSWQLTDCAKVPFAYGAMVTQGRSFILLSGQWSSQAAPLFLKERLPLALPTLGDVGSIVIDIPQTGSLRTARAQRGDEELALELTADQQGC